jgi:transglutaminase-like putative cysteine protease
MKKSIVVLVMTMLAGICVSSAFAVDRGGVVTVEVDLSNHEPGKEVRLWLPYAVSDRDQLVSDIKISGNFTESAVYTDRMNKNPILYAQWPKDARTRKLSYTFRVLRHEVLRRDFPKKSVCWDPSGFGRYLSATSLGPVDGEVKKLADAITAKKTDVLAKAEAIYNWVCSNMYRDPTTRGCGKGDVCELLRHRGGKCTDISSVFVALCRAAGVPAREIFGIRLGKKPQEDITGWQHCWAEFYLPGYGWVPADPADVRKAILTENLTPGEAKAEKYRKYFWGGIDANRVKLAVGRDVVLNPPQAGPPLNTFGYPYAEVDGKPLDWLEPKTFSYRITYRER